MADLLNSLLRPRSVVFVGASTQTDTYAGRPLTYTKAWDFPGRLYVVNPRRTEVNGVPSVPRVSDIEDDVDLAVLLLPAALVRDAVADCAAKGVRACLVIASGFGETGAEGRARQQELADVAAAGGMRLVGPNSAGLVNLHEGLIAKSAYLFRQRLQPGGVAFVTQSGSLSTVLFLELQALGITCGYIVDTGNESDVDTLEVADALLDDPDVRVIAGYAEAFKQGDRLLAVGRRALAAGKPIVLLTPRNPAALSSAVASHTGAIIRSSGKARDAVLRQAGIIATTSTEVFCHTIAAYAKLGDRTVQGSGVGIVSGSGGAGILLADACLREGLTIPTLADKTATRLGGFLPGYASLANPVDITGAALDHPEFIEQTMGTLFDDPGVDQILLNFGRHHSVERAGRDTSAVIAEAARTSKPLFAYTVRTTQNQAAVDQLAAADVPVFHDTEVAARVIGAMHARTVARDAGPPLSTVVTSNGPVPTDDAGTFAWLAAHGVPVAPFQVAASADEAVAAAEALGYPVALKMLDAAHKTELGGVHLSLGDATAVRAAWERLPDRVLVQAMRPAALEVVVGLSRAGDFGPLVMVGLGGTLVEALREVEFAGLPLTRPDLDRLLTDSRLAVLLKGFRGRPALDRAALEALILRCADLFVSHPELTELELNPVLVGVDGVWAVDVVSTVESQ